MLLSKSLIFVAVSFIVFPFCSPPQIDFPVFWLSTLRLIVDLRSHLLFLEFSLFVFIAVSLIALFAVSSMVRYSVQPKTFISPFWA